MHCLTTSNVTEPTVSQPDPAMNDALLTMVPVLSAIIWPSFWWHCGVSSEAAGVIALSASNVF